jgi:uncharacterized protein (DUF1330 family)
MPKAYWIAHVDVSDPEIYKQYIAANAEAFGKYGAKFLVRGGTHEVVEGALKARHVVIEFKDLETARACYASPEYARAIAIREKVSVGDLVIIEGYDGPQPGN